MARPNILMFGDWSWSPRRTALQSQREDEWLESIGDHQRVVVVELGAGTAIPSVRNFSQRIIYEFGGRLVRINPREFQVPSSVDVGMPLGSLEALLGIDEALGDMPLDTDRESTGGKLKAFWIRSLKCFQIARNNQQQHLHGIAYVAE
jgi:hypothetical protein